MTIFERKVHVSPAFCWLHDNPSKNYGIGACRIWFYLIGPKGAVQWQISTDWYTDAALRHLSKFPPCNDPQPSAWDLGYHAKEPQYEGQSPMNCDLLGGECYYVGSSLNAMEWREGFLHGGTDWLWPKLEEYYRCVFEGGKYPDITPVVRPHPGLTKVL